VLAIPEERKHFECPDCKSYYAVEPAINEEANAKIGCELCGAAVRVHCLDCGRRYCAEHNLSEHSSGAARTHTRVSANSTIVLSRARARRYATLKSECRLV
jgi:hypothetical protein